MSEFDIEYTFEKEFNAAVLGTDAQEDLVSHTKSIVDTMLSVLTLHSGIANFTTFTEYNNVKYKINVKQ
ncbi:hypothetical protein EB118_06080 [bacterium]|nr:hypothetical protein [bacterium]NDC93780.1 hypothetical protein [bacterium]NDD83113.1 hypothetical protein [bacterium]NDG29646.1 hypothetical protein [bacterium]